MSLRTSQSHLHMYTPTVLGSVHPGTSRDVLGLPHKSHIQMYTYSPSSSVSWNILGCLGTFSLVPHTHTVQGLVCPGTSWHVLTSPTFTQCTCTLTVSVYPGMSWDFPTSPTYTQYTPTVLGLACPGTSPLVPHTHNVHLQSKV